MAGAMWGYVRYQDGVADDSRRMDLAARREGQLATERAATVAARVRAEADRIRAQVEIRRSGDAPRSPSADPPVQQQAANATPSSPSAAAASGSSMAFDGSYAGPICYGEGRLDPARCFRGQATISGGKINGQWPTRDTDITMHVTGNVTQTGDATIEMHTRNPAGIALSTINLTGTVHDGRLDASGSFVNGRPATINWRRN